MPTDDIPRSDARAVRLRLRANPVVAILGPRQVGKTTLAAQVARDWNGPVHRFDFEDPRDVSRMTDAGLALRDLRGLVVLDEVQRRPDIFPILRVLADRRPAPARFLVLGSASPELLRQSSETLAGRIAFVELDGFCLDETGAGTADALWFRGGFPPSFLAPDDAESAAWRRDFLRTFLERDVPGLGIRIPAETLRRFWTMLAHRHGAVWNASEFARSLGFSDKTVRSHLDVLRSTYVVRTLRPWHENVAKRQVKSPKVYIADTGLLHALLGIDDRTALLGHPILGASWEWFAIREIVRRTGARWDQCWFWATHQGAELDLLVTDGTRRTGYEVKRAEAPSTTRSMHIALAELKLDRLVVVHAGEHAYPLADRIDAVPLTGLGTTAAGS